MIILPAIDIKDGKCVRLWKGDFQTAEQVAESYMDTAQGFAEAGAQWIHMVDLDGAKSAQPVNADIFLDVAKHTPLKVELGGGIRSLDTVEYYLSGGISRVILGSIALKNPRIVKDAVTEYGDRIAVGIDANNGKVAAEGWLDDSDVDYPCPGNDPCRGWHLPFHRHFQGRHAVRCQCRAAVRFGRCHPWAV